MRLLALTLLMLATGCATSSRTLQALGFPARDATSISDAQAQSLGTQLADLQSRREALRASLGKEADPDVRAREYRDIADLGNDMAPLARQLRAAGRPVP